MEDQPFDIYIVGLGISAVRHVTREVEAAIRQSREVFFVAPFFGIEEYLRSLCNQVTDLYYKAYHQDVSRVLAYDVMASAVIEAAFDHPPVTFAVGGHPLVYVFPSQQILAASQFLNLRVKVMPGISALDTILVDLNLDPSVQGLQMYEATDLLLRRRPLQPDVPCLIWQVGTVGTNLFSYSISKPERFANFKSYLLEFYPGSHPVTGIYSSTHPIMPSILKTFPIAELDTQSHLLHQSLTLYIPPVRIRPVADEAMIRRLEDREYLNRLVVPVHD